MLQNSYIYEKIGERIQENRKKLKLTQKEIVELIKENGASMGRNAYIDLENGNVKTIHLDVLIALCKIFHCDMGYLTCEYDVKFRIRENLANMFGLSDTATSQLLASDNSRTFVNYFLEYEQHYEIAQTMLNYCLKAASEKSKDMTFRNAADAHNSTAIMYGERSWAIQKYTDLLNTLYDPSSGTGNYQEFLDKYGEQKKSLKEYKERIPF